MARGLTALDLRVDDYFLAAITASWVKQSIAFDIAQFALFALFALLDPHCPRSVFAHVRPLSSKQHPMKVVPSVKKTDGSCVMIRLKGVSQANAHALGLRIFEQFRRCHVRVIRIDIRAQRKRIGVSHRQRGLIHPIVSGVIATRSSLLYRSEHFCSGTGWYGDT